MKDAVRPDHYKRLDPEPKDVIHKWRLNFNLGNAVKYISRAGHKDDIVQDLKKAQEYIQFEIDAIEAERAKTKKVTPVHPNCKCEPPEVIKLAVPFGMDPEEVIKQVIEKVYNVL